MRLINRLFIVALTTTVTTTGLLAKDCGAPPVSVPILPSVAAITTENLRDAREDVVSYSDTVDDYVNCMDRRGRKLLPYMSKAQQQRWEQDLNKIHEGRRQLQITLNDIIREYRKKRASR